MPKRIFGIDVGGTFTDIAVITDGHLEIHKLSSTLDPSIGVMQGLSELLKELAPEQTGWDESAQFVHGSTVATNALLEGKGSRTALITTLGFEDVLEIGRQARSDLYDFNIERSPALAPWELRFGVSERIDHTGTIIEDLTPESIETLIKLLDEAEVESVAISTLFSFLNPVHENMIVNSLAKLPNPPFTSISSQILPEFREYERTSTVVVNSYVGPIMSEYLGRLETSLSKNLRIMQSSGGSINTTLASERPVRTILSGPAGGVVGAFHTGMQAGYPDIITLDMGGTSTDVSVCPGLIKQTTSAKVGGYPIGVPMIEIHTVGAGGGSIARVDSGGALVVGPESAGADPGPACYGKGTEITVSDANLVLGRLQANHFLGGQIKLDLQRSIELLDDLATEIGTTRENAALGIIRVVNSNMERAIRSISLERGHDPRQFTLIPFGGAGPMHACELAEDLGIPRILIPEHPGVLSALGVAIADVIKDYSRTVMLRGEDINHLRLEEEFHGMESQAKEQFHREGFNSSQIITHRLVDTRYLGQSFELPVNYPERPSRGDLTRSISASFYKAHMQRFGYADKSQPIEIVNLRVQAEMPVEKPELIEKPSIGPDPSKAVAGFSHVTFSTGSQSAIMYHRSLLEPGNYIKGPALLLQMDSTIVLSQGWSGIIDGFGNLIVTIS